MEKNANVRTAMIDDKGLGSTTYMGKKKKNENVRCYEAIEH